MATHVVKLAKRGALLRLNNGCCKVKIKGYGGVLTTGGRLTYLKDKDGNNLPFIKIVELDELWRVEQVTHIEVEVSRFTPDIKSFMEIDWED